MIVRSLSCLFLAALSGCAAVGSSPDTTGPARAGGEQVRFVDESYNPTHGPSSDRAAIFAAAAAGLTGNGQPLATHPAAAASPPASERGVGRTAVPQPGQVQRISLPPTQRPADTMPETATAAPPRGLPEMRVAAPPPNGL